MRKISRLILPAIFIVVIAIMFFTYFATSGELGSFSKYKPGSEINQEIIVAIVKDKGFKRDANGNINSFFARDINNVEVKVTSHKSIPAEIVNSEVVKVLGHMHGNGLVASKISIVK